MDNITPESHPQEFIKGLRRIVLDQREEIKDLNAELKASQEHGKSVEADYRKALDRISKLKGEVDVEDQGHIPYTYNTAD